ncbi:hypothetical protein CEXT_458271 [Caerostris extrusa]|uniref:Secreted protein n=1 Tax=Caerostris extrusa TaxID=172846 RepID=A0AAV4Y934_CAEEX|nr:hypothetical protein CEXT_458271 [Caerostris extrusa]
MPLILLTLLVPPHHQGSTPCVDTYSELILLLSGEAPVTISLKRNATERGGKAKPRFSTEATSTVPSEIGHYRLLTREASLHIGEKNNYNKQLC